MHYGNFVSGQVKEHTNSTAILDMEITKSAKTGKISIDCIDYTPVYCYDRGAGSKDRYELIDIRAAMTEYESGDRSKINTDLYNKIKMELANMEKVLGDPIKDMPN